MTGRPDGLPTGLRNGHTCYAPIDKIRRPVPHCATYHNAFWVTEPDQGVVLIALHPDAQHATPAMGWTRGQAERTLIRLKAAGRVTDKAEVIPLAIAYLKADINGVRAPRPPEGRSR